MTRTPTPTPAEENKTTKTRSPAIVAATAYNRILAIELEEAAELKQSPEAIKTKHAERRAKAKAALSGEARVILDGMLAARKPTAEVK